MRLNIGRKLAIVIVIPAILAAALAAFALFEEQSEHRRATEIASLSDRGLRTHDLSEFVQAVVIASNAVTMEPDRAAAEELLADLKGRIEALDGAETAFFRALGDMIAEDRRTQIALRLTDFKSYQTDTAGLAERASRLSAVIVDFVGDVRRSA